MAGRESRGDQALTPSDASAGLAALTAELADRLRPSGSGDVTDTDLRRSITRLGREAARLFEAARAGRATKASDDTEGRR